MSAVVLPREHLHPAPAPAVMQAQIVIAVPAAIAAVRGSLSHAALRDESLLLKTALAEALGGASVRPWRLMGVRDGSATILGYTDGLDADALRERLAFATPALQQAVSVVATAPMPPLRAGQRLRFAVRLVPTVHQTKGGEVDAFLHAVRQAPDASHDRPEVYIRYLTGRVAGATLEAVRMEGMRLAPMLRRHAKKGWAEKVYPVAEMSGELAVADPLEFARTLAAGVGRQRMFGAGLIRLEPVCARRTA